ncbi:hypothetical protein C9890_0173 [Perkinsus sp. BL_2016]|nr:hypothetical protein C9890_0173 [Perkinsus sp. BL_2016]
MLVTTHKPPPLPRFSSVVITVQASTSQVLEPPRWAEPSTGGNRGGGVSQDEIHRRGAAAGCGSELCCKQGPKSKQQFIIASKQKHCADAIPF